MSKRRTIKQKEALIRRLLQESDDSPAQRAWNRLTDFYATIDELESSNHCTILRYLYRRTSSAKETVVCIALKHNISESTLYRCRQKYINCFFMYYQKELHNAIYKIS